jgi:hypothetical protein
VLQASKRVDAVVSSSRQRMLDLSNPAGSSCAFCQLMQPGPSASDNHE